MNCYVGIDPGAAGGLAVLYPESEGKPVASAMPPTARGVWDWLRNCSPGLSIRIAIERVGGYVGGEGQPGSAMFNFGCGYGQLVMAALAVCGEEPVEVPPRTWQKWFGIEPRRAGETRTHWKNRLKKKAKEVFPGLHVTLYTADALLIAEWLRQQGVRYRSRDEDPERVVL